ncbi:T9SS type A sorting domain-containing protein [Bacteroidota bacterium]
MLQKFIFNLIVLQLLLILIFSVSAQDNQRDLELKNLSVSFNGSIIHPTVNPNAKITSENGKYWCTFDIGIVTDEDRELVSFKFYSENKLLFTLPKAPGSDVDISNAGYVVFFDHSEHFLSKLKLHLYSPDGKFLFNRSYSGADIFGFSKSGNKFGIRNAENLSVVSFFDKTVKNYEKGNQFDVSENDKLITIASENEIKIFDDDHLIRVIKTDLTYPREVQISSNNLIVAVIDKRILNVYSITDGRLLFSKQISGDLSYRDLKIVGDKIVTGIQKRTETESTGLLRIYTIRGILNKEMQSPGRQIKHFEGIDLPKENNLDYDSIPWPFAPFDSMRTIWNHYEQHMGSGISSSYLHQGLDIITPVGEHTYAVADGIVKCVLTLGGSSYWRIAISDTQVAGYSDGWLYAHLIQNTIQFDVGDTVHIHDYLGDIIYWSSNWGHIHFVQIRDTGLVWSYSDNEWGINFNPMLALQPLSDTTPPFIDTVFNYSKFGFCLNETSTYLQPDSLYGNIDIIVKVVDYAGASEWQQPAYRTYYWIKKVSNDSLIYPRTMGQILNHQYPFYESDHYVPYATVIYKRDAILHGSSWMDTERNYHHVVTNSNGDSLIELSEKNLAFSTTNYLDGVYRIFIEVFDEAGNTDIDSMDVQFKNGITSVVGNNEEPVSYSLKQNFPNPFNPETKIEFEIPKKEFVQLIIYDVLGREVAMLMNKELKAGSYNVVWNAEKNGSGVYFYKIKAGDFTDIKRMLLVK